MSVGLKFLIPIQQLKHLGQETIILISWPKGAPVPLITSTELRCMVSTFELLWLYDFTPGPQQVTACRAIGTLYHSNPATLSSASRAELQPLPLNLCRNWWFAYKNQKFLQYTQTSQFPLFWCRLRYIHGKLTNTQQQVLSKAKLTSSEVIFK